MVGGLFVVVDLTAANRDDTPTSGVFLVAEFEAPFACLHFLSSISVCVNGPPLGIRNGVHCLYKTNAAALASVVRCIFCFFYRLQLVTIHVQVFCKIGGNQSLPAGFGVPIA